MFEKKITDLIDKIKLEELEKIQGQEEGETEVIMEPEYDY